MKIDKNKNYYKTLGFGIVDELGSWKLVDTPDDKDIKTAYRNLSKKYHPDINKDDDAQLVFEAIVEAYKILSSDLRDKYDTTSRFGIKYDNTLELYDFEFSNESDSIDSVRNKANKYDKSNIIDQLIELDEFKSVIDVDRYVTCSYCSGNGIDVNKDTMSCDMCEESGEFLGKICTMCNGAGLLSFHKCPKCVGDRLTIVKEKILIKLEDFIDNELIIKLKGNNDRYEIGKVGNLYIRINI